MFMRKKRAFFIILSVTFIYGYCFYGIGNAYGSPFPANNVIVKKWLQNIERSISNSPGIQGSSSIADDSIIYHYLDTAIFYNRHFSFDQIPAYLNTLGNIYSDSGRCKEAIKLYKLGLFFYNNGMDGMRNRDIQPILYNNIAKVYWWVADYKHATEYFYLTIQKVESELKDRKGLGNAYYNLADVLSKMKEYKKAAYYLERARMIAYMENDKDLLESVLVSLGDIAILSENNSKKALYYYEQIIDSNETNAVALKSIGLVYIEHNQPQLGIPYLEKALALPINHYKRIRLEQALGRGYLLLNKYKQSEQYLLSSLAGARKYNIKNDIAALYSLLGELYEKKGNLSLALQYQKQYLALYRHIYSTENANMVNMMELKYRTAQKDKRIIANDLLIAEQKASILKKNLLLICLASGGIVILLIILPYYLYRKKLQVKKGQIGQQEQELKLMQAVIDGEEKERSRMARELHDGIGGLLSTTKMYLETIKERYELLKDAKDYGMVMKIVEDTITEVRTSAHNMLPELLLRHGLAEAVKRYCQKVVDTKKLELHFQSYGKLDINNTSIELYIYRIIQELIHNILKHAKASKALVQISVEGDLLGITVEDNGIGMEDSIVPNFGIGLSTIRERVQHLGGQINLVSAFGKGTYIYIEFDLKQQIIAGDHKSIYS